jgi:hypothetical protein
MELPENNNYTTVICHICKKKFPISYTDYNSDILNQIHTCDDCSIDDVGHRD